MNKNVEKAAELFKSGCNCAQSVAAAFPEETGLSEETLMKLSSAFGGGVARRREVCGAVSGMLMVLGMLKYDKEKGKTAIYSEAQELIKEFENAHGSIICRELLKTPDGKPPCAALVIFAVESLSKYVGANSIR